MNIYIYIYEPQEIFVKQSHNTISPRRRARNIFSSEDKKYPYYDEEN